MTGGRSLAELADAELRRRTTLATAEVVQAAAELAEAEADAARAILRLAAASDRLSPQQRARLAELTTGTASILLRTLASHGAPIGTGEGRP